jgi:hypothetical protein
VGEPVEPSCGCAVYSHDDADTVGSPAGERFARVTSGFWRTATECTITPKDRDLQLFWPIFVMERTGIEPVSPSLQS